MQIVFTSGIGPDTQMNVLKECIIFLVGRHGFCLIIILRKNKSFQHEPSLKMSTSSPSTEKFCLDIQKKISLKQTKTQLFQQLKKSTKKGRFQRQLQV